MNYILDNWRYQRWETHERHYTLRLNQDLFSHWNVTCAWGSKDRTLGQVVHYPAESYVDAVNHFETLSARRVRRHYTPVE